jgi:hypothetical protein
MYTAIAEDHKSITIIETIIANRKTISPVIIIQGRQHIKNWYLDKLKKGIRVVLSESRYINKEISLILLNYIILHISASLNKP